MMGHGPGRMLSREAERASDVRGTLNRLSGYLRPHGRKMLLASLCVVVSTFLNVIGPPLIGRGVDLLWRFYDGGILAETAWQGLSRIMLLLLAAYAGAWAADLGTTYLMMLVGQQVLYELRSNVFDRLLELSLSFFDRRETGDLMSRLTNDADVINRVLSMGLVRLVSSGLTVVGILVAMLGLNWQLALVSFSVLPIMLFTTFALSSRARGAFRKTRQTIGGVSAELEENIAGVRVAQAFSREDENLQSFREVNAANRDANINAEQITAGFSPALDILSTVAIGIVLGYGGYLALRDLVTLGVIVAFVQYVQRFFQPVRAIATIWVSLQSAIAGAERIFELQDTPLEVTDVPDAVALPPIVGEVVFDEVDFHYTSGEPVLQGVSLRAEPGQTVALVGPTGAGKTTVVNLIARFYDVHGGRVIIDGHDVRRITHASLRSQLGVVLQDTFLFSDTVMENIRYGRLDAGDDDVVEAAKLANAHDFISRLPDGYQTTLTEQATNLSQGQRQLISIARAVLAKPRILILDEATSSVDTRTEQLIQQALQELLRGRTSFVIAHRLSTIRNADQVLFIHDGRIVEQGTHEELLANRGPYFELYQSQYRRESESERALASAMS
jgi:ATP-binding cassette subfamily B multidrug efflux pump